MAVVAGIGAGQAQLNAVAPVGQGFTVTPADLAFILKQIKIAERHAATLTADNPCGTLVGPGPDQIPDRLTSYGLRSVDGSCNNLFPGRETWAASEQVFPRLTAPLFRDAEAPPPGFGPPTPTSYKQKTGLVFDSQPRVISNLIVDQTSTNPAAVAAAGFPVRSQGNEGLVPCTTDPDPTANPPVEGSPAGCVPSHHTLFIPNVTTDVGLSPPFNSVFTFFGQFFDHGVDQTVKSGGTVFVPLRSDDPLRTLGPDGRAGTGDEVPASQAFMVLTRAQNQPGPDGVLGTADDIQNATNTDTPLVDQSQTYTSHPSHQVFLREYVVNAQGRPVNTGKLLGGMPGNGATGMATWESVKAQALNRFGMRLADIDALNVPMVAADPYGNFIPGPNGLPQYVTRTGLVEGNLASPVPVPANVLHFDIPFLTDIAHNADPSPQDSDHNPATPPVAPTPDPDNVASADFASQPPGTYDDEMLNAHFCAGDGRVNENIALTAIHQIFHSEHDRLVADIKRTLTNDTSASGTAALAEWKLASGASGWNGARLFQAARFVTEMEYQHLVFEEFARKIVPAIRPFHVYHTEGNPVIPAEFAHAVYRFGHSMLDDDVARVIEDANGVKTDNSIPLLKAFLNPPEYFNGGPAGLLTPEQAAGQIFMGSSDQIGNEIDEFVTETLRNNLLGLPLDLPTINMARAREAGVPPLNQLRRQLFAATNDGQLRPYSNWSDYGQHLKHPESLVNFVAAYGKHPTIVNAPTLAAKRAAAKAIVDPNAAPASDPASIPADAADFMFSTGAWANDAAGNSTTGLDEVDLWVGGLAEVTNLFGGLLGTTFNYVFQTTLEGLQENDRFYYLARTPGMNLRTQLEGNSFAELVQRNTEGTHTLKADAFATADCRFELKNLAGTPAGFTQFGSTVADDPNSDCDESKVLLRQPDGTIQYRQRNTVDPPGINGQGVYNGTPAVDRIDGGNDNDTFWGDDGSDVIDGQGGDDVALGGDGNDRISDLDGADTLKGGPGNDALDAGPGDDLNIGGDGADYMNGGINDNEAFGGTGDDWIQAGQGADAVFGDSGDDWIQGGAGQDLLIGDHGAPFFDDPAQVAPGNDIFVGQAGENDYDTEGGDDLMAANAAIDRDAGAGGFDWNFHQYNTAPADDDMNINRNLENALPVVVNRDRWQEIEADSGSSFNDVIRGSNDVHAEMGGAGFTGCDVLDQAGVDRIAGLNQIVPQPLTGDLAAVVALSATGFCPLSGPIWGEGDILIGGAGSDLIEGRGGNDVIDGDRELRVGISVRNAAGAVLGRTDLLEHQYLRDASGALTGPTLQAAILAGTIDPGNLRPIREIVSNPSQLDVDTAVFFGPRADYDITVANGVVTIVHARNARAKPGEDDGTDTLRNIERLQFADQTIPTPGVSDAQPAVTLAPTSLTFPDTAVGATAAPQTFTVTNTGNAPLSITDIVSEEVAPDDPAVALDFATDGAGTLCGPPITLDPGQSCVVEVRFTPAATGLRRADITIESNATPALVRVSGNGIVAAAPAASLNATSLTFGDQTLSSASPSQSVTLSNSGNAPLSISGIAIAGANASDFTRGGTCAAPSSLAAGSSCTISVTFNPSAAGARTASIVISDSAAGSPHSIAVSGNGIAPVVLLGQEVLQPAVDFNAAGLAEAFRVTATASGTLSTLRVFVDASSQASSLIAGLYAANGTHPGALLARGTLASPVAGQWNNVALANGASVTSGTVYWIALLSPAGAGQLRFRDRCCGGGQPAESSSASNLSTLPASWTTGQSFTDGPVSAVGLGGAAPPDTSAPSAAISAPAGGATVSGTITVSANASDNVGVAGVRFLLDGANLGAEDLTAPYSVSWNTTTVANGTHTLTARARDGAGNATTSAPITVTVNNAAAPPPPAGGTVLLGNAATETRADFNAAGSAEAFKTTAAASGNVVRLRLFVDGASTASSIAIGLYANNAGHPGALLASGTISAPVAGQNNEVAISSTAVTAGQTYWIAILAPSGTLRFRDRGAVGAGNSETSLQTNLAALPATWSTGQTFADGLLSAVGLG